MRKTAGEAKQEKVNVVGSSTFGRYNKISSATTVNMFITDKWICNTAGYQRILEFVAGGEGRGLFTSIRGNFLLAVVGQGVYRIETNLTITFIGNLVTAVGEVFMDENLNSQICLVDGLNAYIYNHSLLPNITIQGGLGTLIPNYVEYHNTFFLFGNGNRTPNGSAWYAFSFATPTTIALTTQFALQTKPDYAIAIMRLPGQGNNILVFGTAVCEIWTQVGGTQNYLRNSTINIDYGCISVSTIDASDKYIAWLGVNENNAPVILVYTGQTFSPISTDGIDYKLANVKFPGQSTAMFYRQDGHLFYQLTFFNPADNLTLIYDFTTEMFFNLTDFELNFHPARQYAYFNLKTYFLSLNNASLYQSSTDFTTYNENLPTNPNPDPNLNRTIQRIRITDTIRALDSSGFRANTFVFTIEQGNDPLVSGVSLLNNENLLITEDLFAPPLDVIYTEFDIPIADETSGLGIPLGDLPPPYQPRVDLSISRDGGITWSNTVARYLNPVAIRQNIINWENMGTCNSLTLKLRFWGLDRFVAYDGVAELY
jgi:hypothetical protein